MRQAEANGKTVDDALRRALDQIGATKDDVDRERVAFDVLDEGRKGGLFGRGARDALVRAYWAADQQAGAAPSAPQRQQPARAPRSDSPQPAPAASSADTAAEADPKRRRRGGRGRGGRSGEGAQPQGPSESRGDRRDAGAGRSGYEQAVPKLTDADFTRPRFDGAPPEQSSSPRPAQPRQRGSSRPPSSGDASRGPADRPERSDRPERPERRHRDEEPAVEPDINAPAVDFAAQMVDDLLRIFDIPAEISIREPVTAGDGLGSVLGVIDIMGEDLGVLIGRRGDTLIALQYLVNLILSRHYPGRGGVTIDVEHYRHRNEERIISLARRMADRVRETGSSITLEPMSPAERRLIHIMFVDDPELVTNSIGEGEHRKVVISRR
jgi:spoIIIJ-associated protein